MIEALVKIQSPITQNWQVLKLGQICKTTSGGTPSRGNTSFYGGSIPWVKSGELEKGIIYDTEEKITEEAIKNSSAKVFPKGTLLIALYGATIGKMAFLGVDAATNQAVCGIFKNDNVDLKYLYYFLLFKRPKLVQQGIGGAQPNISQTILKDLDVPLPPLPIQQAIVAKLEALFSELDKGIEQLKTSRQQLRTYRQAVLKAAFEGRLTGEQVKEGELPEGWKWVRLGDLAESVRNGYSKKPDDAGNNKILRISSVRPGKLDLTDYRLLEKPLSLQEEIQENDLLFTRYNGSIEFVGVGARVPKLTEPIFYPDKLIRCRLKQPSASHSRYVEYASNYGQARKFVLSRIKTTAGQTGISGAEIKEIPIPLPPSITQEKIVSEIESRLSVADKLEDTIAQGLQQAEALRQSILKKAFEGELITTRRELGRAQRD